MVVRRPSLESVKKFLQPTHRRVAGLLPLVLRRHYLYLAGQGRLGSFDSPLHFTEKINWRIINDRRELISWTCDKLSMRDFASQTASGLGLKIPRLLWQGESIDKIRGSKFDVDWVLKPNHRSGLIQFHEAETRIDESIVSSVAGWLSDDQGVLLGEWAYSRARRTLIAEENILPKSDLPDYKFFVFGGVVKAIQLDQARFSSHTRDFYSKDWQRLDVENRFPCSDDISRPAQLNRMCTIAERLGELFDFIRVDLYLTGDDIWFGELTPYPGGGVEPFRPSYVDVWLGQQWRLPAKMEVQEGTDDSRS